MIEELREKLRHRIPSEIDSAPDIRASVVVPLYRAGDEEFLILMRRTLSVTAHPGEISFPGGMRESTDGDSQATALRECCEEIAVEKEDVEVIGRLDDERTLTGFVITPFVGIIPFPYRFSLSEREVSYLIHLPLQFLIDSVPVLEPIDSGNLSRAKRALGGKAPRAESPALAGCMEGTARAPLTEYKGGIKEIHALYYKGERVWGATCRLLLQLKRIMSEL